MTMAIAVAIPQELDALLEDDDFWQPLPQARGLRRAFTSQQGRGTPHVLLLETGLGPLNAAASVASVATYHDISQVVMVGLCGAIGHQLKIGDAVVADALLQHDSFRSSSSDQHILLRPGVSSFDKIAHATPFIDTDPELTKQLVAKLVSSGIPTHSGVMASGSEFMCSIRRKKGLLDLNKGIIAVDMEACGAAMACENMGIAFSAVKIVSDLADPGSSTIIHDFQVNLEHCLANVRQLTRCIRGMRSL